MKRCILAAMLLISMVLFIPAQDGPETVQRGTKQFSRRVLISGLQGPWEMTWGPDNQLWVTERTGKRVTRVDPTTGEKNVAITIDEVSAPGGQDGLLGMALHPELLRNTGNDYVYVAYSYVDRAAGPNPNIPDEKNPYRYLYAKIVRLTYNAANGTLGSPVNVITGLPAGNDHNAGRLKFGPDKKLYLTLGDRGHDQLGNFCLPIEAQRLPTAPELKAKNYVSYVGKSLRINLDGSVPKDNAKLNGVVSHVFTYGHRNPQGIDFGPDGTLYSSEQGPKSDDEVNILKSGKNYGWPHVAGMQDNKSYQYARWAEASTPCSQLKFNDLEIHPSVPREDETAFKKPFEQPIATMFTVPNGFNFRDPVCKGVDFICWPSTGNSNVEYYASKGTGIPGWDKVLLVTTLKRGSLYVLPLTPDGHAAAGHFDRYFQSDNRYRDTAISPDGRTIYIATDFSGVGESVKGGVTQRMQDPGAILAFTYEREGTAADAASQVSQARPTTPGTTTAAKSDGPPPVFTAAQSAAGKTAYNANCAVCHGSTMTNGTFGVPLAGEYFKTTWSGRTVKAFYDHARKMPPAAPGSLPAATYTNVLSYIFEINGYTPGPEALPADNGALEKMTIK